VIGPKKLVNEFLHFFCTLSNRRNTVHFSYVPSVLELELCMGWKCTWCFVAMNFGFIFIDVHLLKAFCYIKAVTSCLLPFLSNFFCTPVKGQPLLSGHFFWSPKGGCWIEVWLYSLTNQCYFSLTYTLWKLEISIKQCWCSGLSISMFCVGTFDMFKQLLSGDYWHPKIENVNSHWVCPHSPCWGKTLIYRCIKDYSLITGMRNLPYRPPRR